MIGDEEFNIGILYLSVLDSKMSINECIAKSGLTADQISNIISIPKFQKYFDKEIDEELLIFCKTDWITEDIRKHVALSDSESEILEKVITENLMNHISKYWKEGEKVKRDFETRNLSEWIISEFVFLSGFAMWFREKDKDNETDLSSLLSNATGENIEAKANIEFDHERLNLVSSIPTQIIQKLMGINAAGKIAYRSLDMAVMKAMSEGNPEIAKKMKYDLTNKQKAWWKFW